LGALNFKRFPMSMTFAELEKGLAEGTIIRIRNGGIRTTFTVRKTSFGVGVERIFTLCSPWIETIEVKAHNIVRRSKLYYLRDRAGRSARLREERSRK